MFLGLFGLRERGLNGSSCSLDTVPNFTLFIYFEQYLVRGAQISKAGLNGALMKR